MLQEVQQVGSPGDLVAVRAICWLVQQDVDTCKNDPLIRALPICVVYRQDLRVTVRA